MTMHGSPSSSTTSWTTMTPGWLIRAALRASRRVRSYRRARSSSPTCGGTCSSFTATRRSSSASSASQPFPCRRGRAAGTAGIARRPAGLRRSLRSLRSPCTHVPVGNPSCRHRCYEGRLLTRRRASPGSAVPASARPASSGAPADRAGRPGRGRARPVRPAPAAASRRKRVVVHVRVHVAEFGEARRHGREVEVVAAAASSSSSQRSGAETGRVRAGAYGVGGGDGAVAGGLVVVDEDPLAALLLPPGGGDLVRHPALQLPADGDGGPPHLR